ncbi:aminotransferase class III-fold pyridoxal phosphate-dependent enzyme [Parasphingorhabdus pacifica]
MSLPATRTYELDRAHVMHSWSAQAGLDPMVVERAEGVHVWDADGHRYLDFTSQLVNTNIGHQHPAVVEAVQSQAARLCTISPACATEPRSQAARLIAERTPDGLDKIFFTNGGAEAVENAVRMARLHTGRHKVLSRYRSYHGATATAVNLTGDPRRWPNEQSGSGTVHFFGPYPYRSPFHANDETEECRRALEHLEQVIELEGPSTIAAIALETVPGTAGIMPPPPGYLQGVRDLCDRHGIVYIADEVMAGFGRTGAWFAVDHYDVVPDLITFAKGVNSGYVPLGGVAVNEAIASTFDHRVYPGGLTYSGHPLACAAAVAAITAMDDEGIVDNAAAIGEKVLGPGLRELAERHPSVGDVRGIGVFWALELVTDRATKEPAAPYGGSSPVMKQLVAECAEAGLLIPTTYHRVHVVPPCTITEQQAREGIAVLDKALDTVDRALNT